MDGSFWRNEMAGSVSAGNVVQAGSIGSVTFAAPPPPSVVPAQVPPPPPGFTDREKQLAVVRGLAAGAADRSAPAVGVVRGMHAVGKTALLRQAAATTRDLFPDGVLYAAFGPQQDAPSEAAERLLRGLGVPAQYVPSTYAQRLDLYRSMSAGLRLLVVFDDVTDAEQVTELRPNSPASVVLAAGNRVLEELYVDGATDIELRPLSTEDGVRLLAKICGAERVDADPRAARELVDEYGGLPLAIRVAGARLVTRAQWSVRRLVDELRAAASGGSQVDARVFAMFDVVYADLPEPLRQLYRVLGVLVGVHFGAEVLAAMCARPVETVRAELDVLRRAGLVEEDAEDTYRLHRMVRRHALHRSMTEDTDTDRRHLLRRAVDWWLLGAVTADVAIDPARLRVPDPELSPAADGRGVSPAAALGWLDREHVNLGEVLRAAAEAGWHAEACRLFEALFAYYKVRKPLSAWLRTARVAVTSAEATERPDTEARCRCLLAKVYQELGHYEEAHAELALARELVADGPERFTASTFDFTGNVCLRQHEYTAALGWFQRALDINRRLGQVRGTALQSMLVARALSGLGRFDEALAMVATARDLVEGGPAEALLPKILATTGAVLSAAGRDDESERVLVEAVACADSWGNLADAADALITLAAQARRSGANDKAERYRVRAVQLLERMGSPRAAQVLAGLDR